MIGTPRNFWNLYVICPRLQLKRLGNELGKGKRKKKRWLRWQHEFKEKQVISVLLKEKKSWNGFSHMKNEYFILTDLSQQESKKTEIRLRQENLKCIQDEQMLKKISVWITSYFMCEHNKNHTVNSTSYTPMEIKDYTTRKKTTKFMWKQTNFFQLILHI